MGERSCNGGGEPSSEVEKVDEEERDHEESRYMINRRSTLALSAILGSAGFLSSAQAAKELEDSDSNEEDDIDVSVDADRPAGTEALLQLIADEYGDVLTDEQLSRLEDDVASNRESAQTLRAFELANGDDMATTFKAYRGSY